MKLSESEENHLKNIYNLQQNSSRVTTNSLAAVLNTSAASITDMLKKLKAKKLLDYKKYYGFKLNTLGKTEALKIIRKHRLWEYFLVSKLGMKWDKIHEIAEELEHVSSIELIERLDNYLGHPKIDPHGDPIPDENGNMPILNQISISQLAINKKAVVSSVSNQTIEMMEMLNYYGIQIGDSLTIIKSFELDGSLLIKIARKQEFVIGGLAAKNIFVYDN
ncbi:MAG: metal-dependent transcriptional regulator [Ginsengibacter sp.]